jgi:hypothetical protein
MSQHSDSDVESIASINEHSTVGDKNSDVDDDLQDSRENGETQHSSNSSRNVSVHGEEESGSDEEVFLNEKHINANEDNAKAKVEEVQAPEGTYVYKNDAIARRRAESRVSARLLAGKVILDDNFHEGADTLTFKSRDNFERIKFKIILSIIYGALFLLVLGLATVSGSNGERYLGLHYALEAKKLESIKTFVYREDLVLVPEQLGILTRGHGFACFCHFVACILILLAAILISPFFCGATAESTRVTQFHEWKRRLPDGKYEKVVAKTAEENV